MQVERNPELELSRRLRLDRVPPAGVTLDVEATDTERAALARRFGVLDVPALTAQVSLKPEGGGRWQVDGRLRATVVQACGITLDPVEQTIDEPLALQFAQDVEEIDRDSGDLIVGTDAAEPLTGDSLDLGELVADQLGLAIDPFPRKPGAVLADILPPPASASDDSPFAALAALKRGGKDDR
jgi:uncharacterized metal-binding protein YceD (DUF177 family)